MKKICLNKYIPGQSEDSFEEGGGASLLHQPARHYCDQVQTIQVFVLGEAILFTLYANLNLHVTGVTVIGEGKGTTTIYVITKAHLIVVVDCVICWILVTVGSSTITGRWRGASFLVSPLQQDLDQQVPSV
jgi:hypothetical protein